MKKFRIAMMTVAASALAAIALPGAPTAQAAPINECGQHLPYLINGYQAITNVTSRVVPCPRTRKIAWQIEQQILHRGYGSNDDKIHLRSHWFHWTGWTIHTQWYHETRWPSYFISQDVRATASRGRVVHYQVFGE